MINTEILDTLNALDTPMLVIDEGGNISWANRAAEVSICTSVKSNVWIGESTYLPSEYSYILHKGIPDLHSTLVECIPNESSGMTEEIRTLQKTNNELEELINSSLDEWYITDGEGITIRVNEQVEKLYGPLVGKSVFEIERQRIFYPSVSAMVLRHRCQQTILQHTVDGRRLLSTGSPIFNSDGSIKRVISYAKDITEFQLLTLNKQLSTQNSDSESDSPPFIANSPAMRRCMDLASKVAKTDVCVLLLGESGVGKNRVAKYVHQMGGRSNGPFIEINCTSIPETLIESELFGYERGSFTGAKREGKPGKVELAEGGTLFLNEIGELPFSMQSKLLDLLQERTITRIGSTRPLKIDLRIVAATNRNLKEMVEKGTFREDLYYRLNVVPITIPSLRDRREDIQTLIETYLRLFSKKYKLKLPVLDPNTLKCMKMYPWPGNIRELENLVERLVITIDDDIICPFHLPSHIRKYMDYPNNSSNENDGSFGKLNVKEQVTESEREIYEKAAQVCRSTRELAKYLKVSQSTAVRKLRQYHLVCRK